MNRTHSTLHTCAALVLALALAHSRATAQTPPATAGGAAAQMVRAAGMPLNDGALPPGSLTVRVVEGAFTGDLRGITVEATFAGSETLRAVTGEKGRAEFAHLPVGAQVRVSAVVRGEQLVSELFPMPAESGVRVLLVTGTGGTEVASGQAAAPVQPAPDARPSTPVATGSLPAGRSGGDTVVVGVFAGVTLLVLALMLAPRWRRQRK